MTYEAEAGNLTIAAGGDAMITRKLSVFREKRFTELIEVFRDSDVGYVNLEMLMHEFEHSPGSAGGTLEGNWEVGDTVIYITYEYANVYMREHIATDVIGSPDNILNWLQAHDTNVVYGLDWIPEIPDGTVKSFKATRRAIEVADQSLTSNDVGDNWIADTSFIDNFLLPTNANVREMYLNQIQLIQYVYLLYALQ